MNYVADLETTSAEQFKIDGRTRVWAVCVREIESEEVVLLSSDFNDFFTFLSKDNQHHKTKKVFFHNLKFDGPFIVDWLLKNGFKHSTERKLNEKEFSTLIANTGAWYEIKICYKRLSTRSQLVRIQDSYKKLPMSEERIAKSFKLETQKGSIDYDKYRHFPYTMTKEEEEYIKDDTIIMVKALKVQFEQGLEKMTIGSDAMNDFKEIHGRHHFKYAFPVLENEMDKVLRMSYKGGWTYLNPKYEGKEVENVLSYDVNSLYPSVMMSPHRLPMGTPKIYYGKYEYDKYYPLYIQRITCKFKLKDNHLPTIQLKNNWLFSPTSYLEHSDDEVVDMVMTSVDLKLFLDHYEVEELEYHEGFKFADCIGVFDDYINKWHKVKSSETGGKRELAKLMLNNLYGKFGTNPLKQSYIPVLDKELDEVKYHLGDEEMGESVYVPMASFITAYAREKTIRSAQKVYPYFVYSDTDSLKLTGVTHEEVCKLLDVSTDPNDLGWWDYEGFSSRAKFLRAKTYIMEDEKGEITVTCAGLPKEAREFITFENFKRGMQIETTSLKQKKVKGGVILEKKPFKIR